MARGIVSTWALFKSNGEFIEYVGSGPRAELSAIDDHLFYIAQGIWYSIQIAPGTNNVYWDVCSEDNVPPPLRALALIMF